MNDHEYKSVIKKKSRMHSTMYGTPSGVPEGENRTSGSVVLSPLKLNGAKHNQKEPGVPDLKSRVTNFLHRRENGWQKYVLPISKLNEEWHPSQKITFERI